MSSLLVIGFFNLSGGQRTSSVKPGSGATTWHCYYDTSIQCESGDLLPAQIRLYSPASDVPHPEGTIAFVLARAHVPPHAVVLMDALMLVPVPGDPTEDSYQTTVPDVLYPIFFALGTVMGRTDTLADGSKKFPIACSEFVRDGRKNSTIVGLFGAGARWANTPTPIVNSGVFTVGTAYQVAEDGFLAISLLHIVLNAGGPGGGNGGTGAPRPPPPGGPNKRQRFAGWPAIASGSQRVASSSSITEAASGAVTPAAPVAGPSRPRSVRTTNRVEEPPLRVSPSASASWSTPSTLTPIHSNTPSVEPSAQEELDLCIPSESDIPGPSAKARGKRAARK